MKIESSAGQAVLAGMLLVTTLYVHSASTADAMEKRTSRMAGPKAVDCGHVDASKSPKDATDCAQGAFLQHKPFRVRYDLQGIDSDVAAGLVLTPQGKLFAIFFDGDPYGGGGTSEQNQRVYVQLCPKPVSVRVTPSGRLSCFSTQPRGHGGIMSPTFESY